MKIELALAAIIVGALALASMVFTYNEPGYAGIARNMLTGEVYLQEAGIHASAPFVFVAKVDLRPQRVCLASTAHAAANCRLVQFDPDHYRAFIATEGWRWYWWSNRLSFNSGYETYRGWRDIMRGYAFAAEHYPFVKISKEYS